MAISDGWEGAGYAPEVPTTLAMLRAFAAVARTGSFQRAADALKVRQPAVSDAIRRLESEAGRPLLSRTRDGVHLTDLGRQLLGDALAAVDAADQVDALLADRGPRLTIGFMGEAAGRRTSWLMKLVRDETNADITLRRYDYADPSCGLTSGQSDLAIVWPPLDDPTIRSLTVASDRRAVALPLDDPLAGRERVDPSELAGRTWVVPLSEDRAWAEFRTPQAVGITDLRDMVMSRSIEETLELVSVGRGAALVSESTDEHYARANVVIVPLSGNIHCSTALAWRSADRRTVVRRVAQAALDATEP